MKNKIFSTALLAVLSFFVFFACKEETDDTTTVIAPTITSFTPTNGTVGTTVTITGTNFSATAANNTVAFNGTAANVTAATTTQLTVTVPTGATTGKITVKVGDYTTTSTDDFIVNSTSSTAPTITSFTPSSGAIGTSIVITGTNFSTTAANNTVTINGVTATVTEATATSLTVTIPAGATTGTISVTVNGQTATSTASFTVTTTTTASCTSATTVAAQVACLADAFKATLTSTQIATLQLSLTKANAIKWSNLPGGVSIRNGLEFSTLTATQLAAANAVIAAASGTTSDEGYSEFTQIRAADDYLSTIGGGNMYSSGEYIIAFLGTPSETGTWMLQFGGHHYAQNITFSGGNVVSITPSHQGVEPTSWTSNGLTYAPLKAEYDAMKAMLASLSAAELTSAKLTATFSDVLLGPNKDGQFPATKQGLAVSSLTTAQKQLVLNAMKPWLQDADDATGAAMLAIYENELNSTYISYSGNATLTNHADYARIDGPSVWIEFVCQSGVVVQNQIHYHTIYRDHTRDYNGL